MNTSRQSPEPSKQGFRERINSNPAIAIAGILLIAVLALLWAFWPRHRQRNMAYFTVDDGATTFIQTWQPAPFDHDGKEAVEAVMYACDNGNMKFVAYLKRYTKKGQELMPEYMANPARMPTPPPADLYEVKRPNSSGDWVSRVQPDQIPRLIQEGKLNPAKVNEYNEVMTVKCPGGSGTPYPIGADPE